MPSLGERRDSGAYGFASSPVKSSGGRPDADESFGFPDESPAAPSKPTWETATAPNGKSYWFNRTTGESRWTDPNSLSPPSKGMTKQTSTGSVYGFGDDFGARRASITSEDGFGFGDIEENEQPIPAPPPTKSKSDSSKPKPKSNKQKVVVADVKASPAVPSGIGRRGSASNASKAGGGSVADRLESSRVAAAERAEAAKVARQEKEDIEKAEQKRREGAFAEVRRISQGENMALTAAAAAVEDEAAVAAGYDRMVDLSPEPLGSSWNSGAGGMRDLGMKASVDFSLLQNTMSGLRKSNGINDAPKPVSSNSVSTSSLKPTDRAKSYHGRVSTSSIGSIFNRSNNDNNNSNLPSPDAQRPKSAIAGLSTSQVFADDDTPEDELEKISDEALVAAQWTNDQITKLIEMIKLHGVRDMASNIVTIKFKVLFDETADVFDALSGICKTAKKYKIIAFEAEQLWQGRHDDTDIVLLKEDFEGVKIKRRKLSALSSPKKSGGFSASTANTGNQKCHICTKTVYPMEYIGASDKAFHKACFRCKSCNKMLSQNDYGVAHDRNFRCHSHHREFEMAGL